jgi:vitamin B12 transport system permease protein
MPDPSHPPQAERFRLPGFLFGILCAAMFGLAVGAVWMLPSMMFGRALPALVLPAGWVLGVVVRRWLHFRGPAAALLAAGATLLAAAYTACLVAAATISGMMGIGLAQAMGDAGPAMLIELARLAQGPGDVVLALGGAALAALVAWPLRVPGGRAR